MSIEIISGCKRVTVGQHGHMVVLGNYAYHYKSFYNLNDEKDKHSLLECVSLSEEEFDLNCRQEVDRDICRAIYVEDDHSDHSILYRIIDGMISYEIIALHIINDLNVDFYKEKMPSLFRSILSNFQYMFGEKHSDMFKRSDVESYNLKWFKHIPYTEEKFKEYVGYWKDKNQIHSLIHNLGFSKEQLIYIFESSSFEVKVYFVIYLYDEDYVQSFINSNHRHEDVKLLVCIKEIRKYLLEEILPKLKDDPDGWESKVACDLLLNASIGDFINDKIVNFKPLSLTYLIMKTKDIANTLYEELTKEIKSSGLTSDDFHEPIDRSCSKEDALMKLWISHCLLNDDESNAIKKTNSDVALDKTISKINFE